MRGCISAVANEKADDGYFPRTIPGGVTFTEKEKNLNALKPDILKLKIFTPMELLKLRLLNLRNEEHYKFNLDFSGLVTQFTPEKLGIQNLYPAYQSALAEEVSLLNVVRASSLTDDLFEADKLRDETYRGLDGTVRSARNHFNPEIRKAATRLSLLLDTYGAIPDKPYDQESAAIIKLVAELEGAYSPEVTALGLAGWVVELKSRNDAFNSLKNQRYSEATVKPSQNLKAARRETDIAYRAIEKRINALIEVNGIEAYVAFVAEMNQRIENYQHLLAQRKGRNTAGEETQEETPPSSEGE